MSEEASEKAVLSVRTVLGFYGRAANRYPRDLLGMCLGLPVVIVVGDILPSLIVASVLNRLAGHQFLAHHAWRSFHTSLIEYVIVSLAPGVLGWRLVDRIAFRLEANVSRDLAQQTFKHLVAESSEFHANTFGGSLVSQNTKLLGSYVRISDVTWFQAFPLPITVLGVVGVMAPRSGLFAVLVVVFSALFLGLALLISGRVRDAGAVHAGAESAQTGYVADVVTNIMAIKSFARESHEQSRFSEATERTRQALFGFSKAHQRQMFGFSVVSGGVSSISLAVAVVAVVSTGANIGTVFLIVNYTAALTQQLFQFSNNSLRTLNRAVGDASDMIEILAREPKVLDPEHPERPRISNGHITFDDVTFTHPGASGTMFRGLNLSIEPGEKIGLVGHSGSGKTTFTRLLLRFSDLDSGRILIDGQDIAQLTQADLHGAIAYVPQEPLLFHRSIEDNVTYGKLDASTAEVTRATAQANASEFIDTLTLGMGTLVGERGVKLSGGQRQRIAIARAMVKNAPILVLDEATSALDSTSEALIQDALATLMEGRTTIVIAHRLSTIQHMDRIIVLDKGRIVEMGTHSELLGVGGIYAGFWARQSDSFIEV